MFKIQVKEAKTYWQKLIGLLGTSQPYPLLLKTRWGIHTFGMRYSIDVVILDDANTIEKLKHCLKPNRIFLWNPKYGKVLELPEGTIKKAKLKIGEKLQLLMV